MKNMSASPKSRQQGTILVMFTIGLFAIIAMVALALDGSDMLLSKGRLQNAVDSAALHAAKSLQDGATLAEARQAAITILAQNLGYVENHALEANISLDSPDYNSTQVTANVAIEFSVLPDPFTPILVEGSEYVRVRVEDVQLGNYLAQVFNFNKRVRASAVAGRSTNILCNNRIVPLLVCAVNDNPDDPDGPYGIRTNDLYAMKSSSNQDSSIGPGNFQMLALSGTGGDVVRKSLAGEYAPDSCIGPGDFVPTEPGNTVGPVVQGLNTRFGQWQGGGLNATDHPRDFNICQGDRVDVDGDGNIIPLDPGEAFYSYNQYVAGDDIGSCIDETPPASAGRRNLPVVIGMCDGLANGRNEIEVLTTGCFFLVQEVEQKGNDSYIVGEFVTECAGAGNSSLDPNAVSNVSTIVLYRDPDSPDS
ncbi:TadE/TadG family type IV pilus assembly protein [Shewanella sedimentimangrovi]|uniref:Pilus assembly protein n=1 Tax=Shewanella sedimentimangrovi TaxID=2814293 RepID=A0ABX7R155_9GAMM|nr:TadE/TadG family type IV pilus assembly protein [Shewanella sedimentimangrovi]QSX36823.1 pilus assembly protein [Shewanella sedimentimangrovi]